MITELFGSVWARLFFLLRPMLKWVLNRVTGKCELLRITYQYSQGAERTHNIEASLKQSKRPELNQLTIEESTNISNAVLQVMRVKNIIPEVHPQFENSFRICLLQICGYRELLTNVEQLRKTKYTSDNPEHEQTLMHLWKLLMPDDELQTRASEQWKHIGFQGNNPETDFRGMGLLGLHQLIHFASKYNSEARKILQKSHHPKLGYSFAIVGINLTDLVYDLLKKGYMRTHFYNKICGKATIEEFHEVYCHVFYEFDKFWYSENPKDIMEFGQIREKYRKKLVHSLKQPNTVLVSGFQKRSD
ncbi:hypothetical protein CHS0354_033476 [Potamilus streckersoni]|uniref:ELMO domain-containing protein n=1 Tax=Potamilus streckersoni TaxID=2493646 RepID=A0AAE0VIV8_9BIVA|nr:hypothetical protein CHS0354_033476 [Potamilus streckersoni]